MTCFGTRELNGCAMVALVLTGGTMQTNQMHALGTLWSSMARLPFCGRATQYCDARPTAHAAIKHCAPCATGRHGQAAVAPSQTPLANVRRLETPAITSWRRNCAPHARRGQRRCPDRSRAESASPPRAEPGRAVQPRRAPARRRYAIAMGSYGVGRLHHACVRSGDSVSQEAMPASVASGDCGQYQWRHDAQTLR